MSHPLDDLNLTDEVKDVLRGIKAEIEGAHRDQIAALEKENAVLKKMLRDNSICPYGQVPPGESLAKCPSGFPGCSCADDMMLDGLDDV
jgi:hypothetical protein